MPSTVSRRIAVSAYTRPRQLVLAELVDPHVADVHALAIPGSRLDVDRDDDLITAIDEALGVEVNSSNQRHSSRVNQPIAASAPWEVPP
jgi:hypothetical protein